MDAFDFSHIYAGRAILRLAYRGMALYALWQEGKLWAYNGSPFNGGAPSERQLDPAQAQLLAPCQPSKVPAIGLNYHLHAQELNMRPPDEPLIFLKPASSVVGPGAAIIKPAMSQRVDFEGELGIVIGRACSQIIPAQALNFVLGYTCLNDVTARDLQAKDGQFTRAKSFDTFCPIGPAIALDVNPQSLSLRTLVNGQVRQQGHTNDMIFAVPEIVSYVSQVMTLMPGDVIATGTPAGIGPLQVGDVVQVAIEGIGCLHNYLAI